MRIIDSRELNEKFQELKDDFDCFQQDLDNLDWELAEANEEISEIKQNIEDGEVPEPWGLERVEEIESDIEDIQNKIDEKRKEFEDWDGENGDDYEHLKEMVKEGESLFSDWFHGVELIHENDFADYVQDLCEDLGYIDKDFPWWIEIDWEATAGNVKHDYSTIEYEGETYYGRD